MANEDKKDFNAMLMDSKDMPKVQIITDEKSIEKYGGDKMYFAPPIDYDKVMRLVPCGKLLTVGTIRDYFAKQSGADFTEPITAGIFVSIVAWASYQRAEDKTPYYSGADYDTSGFDDWDGTKKQSTFGGESEMIIQRGAYYRITKIEKSGYTTYIDMEVVLDKGYDKFQQRGAFKGLER